MDTIGLRLNQIVPETVSKYFNCVLFSRGEYTKQSSTKKEGLIYVKCGYRTW